MTTLPMYEAEEDRQKSVNHAVSQSQAELLLAPMHTAGLALPSAAIRRTPATRLAPMAKNSYNQPLTFDLPQNLIAKIEACRRALALRSTSEVVREALADFDFDRFSAPQKDHRQISVRL